MAGNLFGRLRGAASAFVAALRETGRVPATISPPGGATLSLQRPRPFGATAPMGQDARDLLYVDSIIRHPEFGVTPAAVIAAFCAADGGDPTLQNDLSDGMISGDPHARSLFEKREQASAGKPRVIQAGDDSSDGQLGADVLRTSLERLPLVEPIEHLIRFNRYGYSLCEIDWGIWRIGGRDWIVPTWFTPVPAQRFRINTVSTALLFGGGVDELRLVTDYRRPFGDELRPGKWITLRRSGALASSGLMRTGVWPMLGKRYGFRDWVIWLDKFGKPLPVGSVVGDAVSDDAKETARQAIASIGETRGVLLESGIKIEFPQAAVHGATGTPHQAMIDHCNAEMSKLINGSTLSNDNKGSGGASYALGSVHEGVRWEAVQYDAERLETAFERDVSAPFCHYNNLNCAPPKLKIQVFRDLDPMTRVRVASVYRNELGGKVSAQQMDQELGFREPSGTDDELPGMPAKPSPAGEQSEKPSKEEQ